MTNEHLLVITTPNNESDKDVHWFSCKVEEALKHHDLSNVWVSDSGATKHMTGQKQWLSELRPATGGVKMGGRQKIDVMGIGSISLTVRNIDGEQNDITLADVLHVPGLKVNLFSIIHSVVYCNATIIHQGKLMQLKPNGLFSDTVAVGKYHLGEQLFILDCSVNMPDVDKCFAARETGSNQYIQLMHKRLLHASPSKLKQMYKAVEGVKQMLNMETHSCIVCVQRLSKSARIYPKPSQHFSNTLDKNF